jgi:iron complex transport system substrate-binding protein
VIGVAAAFIFCSVIDDAGKTIQIEKPARRIVSLAPDITEILYASGAGDHVVGVISGSDYPAAAQAIPKVGSYSGVDLEKTLSLHPDLIVTWGKVFSRQTRFFKQLGIPIYTAQPRYLEDISRTINNLGCLAGSPKQASQAAANFSQQLMRLQAQYQMQKPVTVFYQIGAYSLITINKASWINQVIELCGGRNIFANVKTTSAEVNWESIIAANPQVVISDAMNESWKTRWQRWSQITAVKEKRLFSVDANLIDRAGPRLLMGAAQICENLQKVHHQ